MAQSTRASRLRQLAGRLKQIKFETGAENFGTKPLDDEAFEAAIASGAMDSVIERIERHAGQVIDLAGGLAANLTYAEVMILVVRQAAGRYIDTDDEDEVGFVRASVQLEVALVSYCYALAGETHARHGRARWAGTTRAERAEAARAAAKSRWAKTKPKERSATMREVAKARWVNRAKNPPPQ